jgi:hypothetical protein
MLELLREEHGQRQIDDEKNGEDKGDQRKKAHGATSFFRAQFVERLDVKKRDDEKGQRKAEHDGVLHGDPFPSEAKRAGGVCQVPRWHPEMILASALLNLRKGFLKNA